MYDIIESQVVAIRAQRPLILNITNAVTMAWVANGLLSLQASPIMSQAEEELADLLNLAAVLVINIGTLDAGFVKLAEQALQLANHYKKPVVLDPVGVGASAYRTKTCQAWLTRFSFALIRGNASEIIALSGKSHQTKGVDSQAATEAAIDSARGLSEKTRAVLAISGATDAVVQEERVSLLHRGSPFMPQVTGSGCLLSAVMAAFMAVEPNYYTAANSAFCFYGVCGELAEAKAAGPGSFAEHFLDALTAVPKRHDYE